MPDLRSKMVFAYRLRHFLLLCVLGLAQAIAGASAVFITNTFFARQYGNDDCEITPNSEPCRRGTTDAALYNAWSNAASSMLGSLVCMTTGSYSDKFGRLPLLRAHQVLSMMPLIALLLYVKFGVSMWMYLILAPVVGSFDVMGVNLAILTDLMPNPAERAAGYGIFLLAIAVTASIIAPLAFLLPHGSAFTVSILAGCAKIAYLFTIFPETSTTAASRDVREMPLGLVATARRAGSMLTRHSFITRMAIFLTLCVAGSAGYAVVLLPFGFGYLGFQRAELLDIAMALAVSVVFSLGVLLNRLVARIGEVRVLQLSAFCQIIVPVSCAFCTAKWQFLLVVTVWCGPASLCVPLVSGIKANLVPPEEQGLMQGAIGSIGRVTAMLGTLVFGYMFSEVTDDGQISSTYAVIVPFFTIAGFSVVAFALALSLPRRIPTPQCESLTQLFQTCLEGAQA